MRCFFGAVLVVCLLSVHEEDVMARIHPIYNWLPVMVELMDQNARAAAIVMGAFLENNLAVAIISRLRPLSSEQEDDLFGSEKAPFSTFHEKVHIGFALNLYSAVAKDDLLIVKSIRNKFAHKLHTRTFDQTQIAEKCAELSYPAWYATARGKSETKDPKERFMETAQHFIDGLAMGAKKAQRPASKSTLIPY
jgi:hypothetical protein